MMKNRCTIIFIVLMFPFIFSCNSNSEKTDEKKHEEKKRMEENNSDEFEKAPYFPAEIITGDNFSDVQIAAFSGMVFSEQFDQFGLYENGYCWASVIEKLVAREKPKLLVSIIFDPEADTCYMHCSDDKTMFELAELIHEFCSTKEKLIMLLMRIDKSDLDC